jgi:hypothetical protein
MPLDAQQRIDAYLNRLRGRLRGLDAENAREIVEELRSHILDRATQGGEMTLAGVDAALASLGNPEQLAGEYMADDLLKRAEVSRLPWRILESLFRWGSLSVAGFFVLLSAVLGYFLGVVFILVAAIKPFHPQTAGFWVYPDSTGGTTYSVRMGFGGAPANGHELLGWWIVPIGLVGGCALLMLTTNFALWCARQYRRSRALPR